MRRAIALAAVVFLVGCGKDSPAAPKTGTLRVQLDGQTCTGSDAIEVFIDGESWGATEQAAGASRDFEVPVGYYRLGATAVHSQLNWGPRYATIDTGDPYVWILTC